MPTTYLTSAELRRIFGGVCQMTIWRWLRDETLEFPKPTIIRGRRYWDSAEIAAFRQRPAGAVLGNRAANNANDNKREAAHAAA